MNAQKPNGTGLFLRAAAFAAFLASWLWLVSLMVGAIEKIWPGLTVFDPACLAAGALLIPMAAFLIQAVIHLPRPQRRPVFLRARPVTGLSILLFPGLTRLSPGPALKLICTEADRKTIMAEAGNNTRCANSLIPRLSLLLDNRSPLEVLLKRLMNSRQPLSALGWFFFLIMGPARQFMRLWGYVFTRLWRDPGPAGELFSYKRKVAFDLAAQGVRFGLDELGFDEAQKLLANIWPELKRVRNNPLYGQDLGEALPDLPEPFGAAANERVAAFYRAPWLAPRYCGAYLDLPATLAARTVEELYDAGRDEDTSVFYPPELGREVEQAAWLLAERTRLQQRLDERREEGLVDLDGRPVPTWVILTRLFDIEGDLKYYKQRIAAHHRRCRTAHLTRARRLGRGWPEYLRGLAGVLHLAEHARRALETAKASFERESVGEAARLHSLMDDLHGRLRSLDLTEELEVRPPDMPPLALPLPVTDLQTWLEGWKEAHDGLAAMFSTLRDRAITALLRAEDQVAAASDAIGQAPPAPEPVLNFTSLTPVVEMPERVYAMADRLKVGFVHTFFTALFLTLLLWQSQTLGRTRLVIYNGLGRDVVVWVGEEMNRLSPYSRVTLELQPNKVYDIVTWGGDLPPAFIKRIEDYREAMGYPRNYDDREPSSFQERVSWAAKGYWWSDSKKILPILPGLPNSSLREFFSQASPDDALSSGYLVERFSRRLSPTPATEVYNIAGAAPLMLWRTPRPIDSQSEVREKFLGRPRWLPIQADIFFRAPSPSEARISRLVLSAYGELPPSEMLPTFTDERDQGELIYLHALWDKPGSSGFWQWQALALGDKQAEILLKRLAREPDFLEQCLRQMDLMGIQ